MKRALILIITLTLLTVGFSCILDHLQEKTAARYLDRLASIREHITANDMASARLEHEQLHALWEKDAHWLNTLMDHHHARDVVAGLRHLCTALEEQNRLHALLAADELTDALEELSQSQLNILESII